MSTPSTSKTFITLAIVLALIALAFTYLSPSFSVDNGLVYGAF